MFTLLFWLVMYLYEKLLDLIKSQTKIRESGTKINQKFHEFEITIIKEMNEDIGQLIKLFGASLEIIENVIAEAKTASIKTNVNMEQLTDNLKKLEKKVEKKKSAK